MDEGEGRFGWLLLRASLHDPLLVLNVETELDDGRFHLSFLVGNVKAAWQPPDKGELHSAWNVWALRKLNSIHQGPRVIQFALPFWLFA